MAIENVSYENKSESALAAPSSAATGGVADGDMTIWGASREERINTLLNGDYTNNSSYPLPKGIINIGYENGGVSEEKNLGISATGDAFDSSGNPIKGSVLLEKTNGEKLGSSLVEGSFIASTSPLPQVYRGEDGEGIPGSLTVVFNPFSVGIPSVNAGASYTDPTISATYVRSSFTVLDVNGTPVPDDSITTETGERFETNSKGEVEILGPDGKNVALQAFGGSYSKTVKFSQGANKTFRYPGLTVKVEKPGSGEPYTGAPIGVNGTLFKTDEYGEVNLPKLPFGTYTINVLGIVQREITLSAEGVQERVVVGDGSSISGVKSADVRCFDETTKRAIADTPVEIPELGVKSSTNEEGRAATLHDLSETFEVVVARGDPRYLTTTHTVDPSGTTDIELELEPATNRVNM